MTVAELAPDAPASDRAFLGHPKGLGYLAFFGDFRKLFGGLEGAVSLALFARLAPKPIEAAVIGLFSMAFFLANGAVGWIGSLFTTMPVTQFWLIHAALAGGAGVVFVALKFGLASRLRVAAPAAAA